MFDLFKGYAMISILLWHTHGAVSIESMLSQNPSIFAKLFFVLEFILSCNYALMPLFFIISGYGFSSSSMKKCIKKQARTLLKPYLLTSLFVTIVFWGSQYVYSGNWLRSIVVTSKVALSYLLGISNDTVFCGIELKFIGSAWFLLTLFFSWIWFNAITRYVRERYQPLVVLLLVCIGYFAGRDRVIPFCLPQSFIGVGYMYTGQLIKKHNLLFKKLPTHVWVILVSFTLISLLWGQIVMAYSIWKLGLIDIVGAGCFAFLLARANMLLNKYNNTLTDSLRKIGRYSLWIMCVHTVEAQGLFWGLFANHFGNHRYLAFFVIFAIRLCLVFTMCKVVSQISQFLIKRKRRVRQRIS